MPTMNVSLTSELAQFVEDEVSEGQYGSASEVVRDGLRMLLRETAERAEKLALLRQAIEVGLSDIRAGRISSDTIADIGRQPDAEESGGR
jgi:antitoxin ParD1/3/4